MPYTYEPVPGLFNITTWEENIVNSFGLQLPSWAAFCQRIEQLAAEGDGDIKVVYCARHGEAEHNVLGRKYGISDNDAAILYPITDPLLTAVGRKQAMTLGGVFAAEAAQGMPLPTKFFVSPMRRPGETLGLEWGWLFKAGAVSRPGSPRHSRRPSLASASSSAPGSPGKGGKKTPVSSAPPSPGRSAPSKADAPNNVKPSAASALSPDLKPTTPPSPPTRPKSGPVSMTPLQNVSVTLTEASPTEADLRAHAKAVLANSPALAIPEAQGGMSHGVPGLVIEELREHLHVHECDKRLTLTELRALFPHFTFPDEPDEDTVWKPLSVRGRETEEEMVERAGIGLGILFDLAKEDRYVSLTAHSGLLRAVYKNLGVPYRRLVTGEMNVLVIRVRRKEENGQKGRSTSSL